MPLAAKVTSPRSGRPEFSPQRKLWVKNRKCAQAPESGSPTRAAVARDGVEEGRHIFVADDAKFWRKHEFISAEQASACVNGSSAHNPWFWGGALIKKRASKLSLVAFCNLFVMGLVLSGCRQDMHNQPKFIPLRSSEFFPDRRSARYPVAGTVPQFCPNFAPQGSAAAAVPANSALCIDPNVDSEQLNPESYFLTGRHNGILGNDLPDEFKSEKLHDVLTRGQERYNIYCTPCHSWRGDGYGMIVQRGYKKPPSFHVDRLRNAPLGHFFEVMSNGFGAMPDYGAQINPEDRWAIAAYIRALQRSQNAGDADLTAEERAKLKTPAEEHRFPPTSKTDQETPQPPAGGVKR
jgi:mono/diheme cytochrome c family protein